MADIQKLIYRSEELLELIEIKREFQNGDRSRLGYFAWHYNEEPEYFYDGYSNYELVDMVNDAIIETVDMIAEELEEKDA